MTIGKFMGQGRKGPPNPYVTNYKGGDKLYRCEEKNEFALQLTDNVHIHLPESAFTPDASNFWFGALVGAGAMFALLASMAST